MVGIPMRNWIVAGLTFLVVGLMAIAAASVWELWRDHQRRKSVREQLRGVATLGIGPRVEGGVILRDDDAGLGWLAPISARVPHIRDVQHLLRQAKLEWSVQTYLILSLGLALALGLVALLLSGLALFGLTTAVVGALLPYAYARRRKTKRLKRFEAQFPDAVDLLGRAIRAGHPLSSGLKMVAEETQDPVAGEFRQVFEEQRFGMPFEDALLGLPDRIELVDTRIFAAAVLIQREVGGNLAEILDNLSYTIRERFKIRGQIQTYTAEGRFSAYVLTALPVGLGLAVFALTPDYIMVLFTTPAGKLLVVAALVAQVLGYVWMRKIVNIDV